MKFIQNIDYLASINSEESIRPYLDQIIKRFEEDTIKLEKLHNGKNIFSFRLNRQKRVICTFLDKQSQVILIICEILETHQYHRCKYLYCDVDFSKYNIVGITKLVSTGSADKSYLQLPRIASTRLGNKTVLLSDQQLKLIENHQNNSIFTVIGTAGSGKTTLAQLIFSEKSIENNVLYLTKSKKLLSAIKKDYKSINTEVVKPYRAEFKSYESLSSRMIFQKIFEEDNFKSYNKYLSKTIKTTANNETNNPTYEAVQAILQKDKTILQSNIEYNQLNQYIDNKIYYEVKFSEWLKSQKLYNEIKKDNVTIREIYEDIRKLHDAKYCQGDVIGKKTCVNHSRSNEILGLYKDFLKKTFSIDFTLMDLQIGSQSEVLYDYIVVDEAQDFGKSELQYILSFLNKRGNVYFFIDNNQSLLDDFNLTFRYIKELNIQLNKSLHSYQLTVGYRTPENITKLANNILTIKQSVLNGSLSKNTQSSIQSINDNVSEGDVRFLDATESQQSIAHLQAESKISINIVILVPEDSMRIDAVQLFSQGIIMTPEEIKGLEFDKIVLVNFLNKSSINQLTINQLKSINQHQNNHFPKELCPSTLKHNLFFTKLFVSVTRSMYSVYFIQTKKDNISVKLQSLFKETISCETEIKLDASSIEEIMEFITEKKDNFSLKQLLDYCQIAYNRIAASELNDETFEKLNELRAILNIVIVDIEEEPQRSGLTDLQQKIDDSLCQHNTSQPNSLDYQFIGDQNRAHIYSPVADCQQSDENSNFYLRTPPLKPIHEQLSPIPLKCRFSKSRKIISTKNATASASQSIPQKPLLAQTDLQQQDEQLSLTTLQSRDFNINNITSSQLEQIIKDKTVLCFLLNTRIDLINGLNNNDLTDFTTKITSQAINTPNKQGNSALYQLTCSSENIAIFEKIINCNEHIINKISQAGIHKIGPFNWSPFFYLHLHKKGKILNNYKKLGEKFKQKFLSDEPSENEFNIILPKFIKKIIKDYLYTPSVENLQCSALTYAAQWGDKKMIDYLIKQGCNVDIIDREGHSALMSATNNNRKDCVIALVEAGASVNLVRGQNRFSVLHSAIFPQRNLIKSIRNEIVEYLIKHSVDVNCTSCSEESILSSSVINDDIDIVKYLIEAGALVNHRNKFGTTALHYAVIRKNREIIGFLLKYGADPNIKSNFDINKKYIYALPTFMDDKNTWFNEFKKHLYFPDTTPLHLAVQVGSTDITKMLIDANADLSIKNSKGKTAFEIAEDRGETEIVDIFKKAEYLKVTFNESNSNQKVNELSQAMSFSAEQPSFSGLEPQLNKENDRLFHHSEVWIPSNPDTRGL